MICSPAGNGSQKEFFETAEQQVIDTLRSYSERADTNSFQRRLFADDAARGFAFIDLSRKRYDAVVMNPPFGEPSILSKKYVESEYGNSCQDIFAAFVERGVAVAPLSGFVGVLSTESGFFRRTLESWRREVLLKCSTMKVMAHLGGHVLDGATVRTATYVLQTSRVKSASLFLRLLGQEDRECRFSETIHRLKAGLPVSNVYQTEQSEFAKLPYAVFGYWCSPEMRSAFVDLPRIEDNAHVRQGLATADDFRFLRLRWEISPEESGIRKAWMFFAKGGEYNPYHDDIHLAVLAADSFSELGAFSGSVLRNVEHYNKPGITYPRRTNKRFAPRAMPVGCAFGDKGPAIIVCSGLSMGTTCTPQFAATKLPDGAGSGRSRSRRWRWSQLLRSRTRATTSTS